MRLSLISQTGSEPVDLSDVKAQLRVDHTDEDNYLTKLITKARAVIEKETGRALRRQVWDLYLDEFPSDGCPIILPKPPLVSVDFIKYVDDNGSLQTLSTSIYQVAYETGMYAGCARIAEAYEQTYPTTRKQMNAVQIRFTCGYSPDASPTEVPPEADQAIEFLVAHWYGNREPVNIGNIVNPLPFTLDDVIFPLKVWRV